MVKQIYINLPVSDLIKSTEFYNNIGLVQNMNFSNEVFSQFKISDDMFLMLHRRESFLKFPVEPQIKIEEYNLVSTSLEVESRKDVDLFVDMALSAGGDLYTEAQDNGYMYGHGFTDPDGHIWNIFFINKD